MATTPIIPDELKATLEAGGDTPRPRRRRRLPRARRRARKAQEVSHRWLSLILGLALIAVTTSGAVLLYLPELEKASNPAVYEATEGTPISASRALAIAKRDPSGIQPESATLRHGVWILAGSLRGHDGHTRELHIDAATGRRLGLSNDQFGVLGWLGNFHDCGLTCEDYAGYTPFLNKPLKVLGNDELTVGGAILGVAGLMLGWLVVSGLWLWWPSIKRFARGFTVRRGKGTYALNYDLHKVVGIAALPFLAMWALTGAGFEFKQIEDAWYGVLPGKKPPEYAPPPSKPVKGKHVDLAQAERIVAKRFPGSTFRTVYLPPDKNTGWDIQVSKGFDARDHSKYQGNVSVTVDQYSGKATVNYPTAYEHRPLAQKVWQDWQFESHAGTPVNGWWRIVWLAFGLAPLVLAVTGVVTWLIRRRKRRARNRRRRSPVAAAT